MELIPLDDANGDLELVRVTGGGGSLPPGQPGQVVGYDDDGNPMAVNLPDGTLPPGAEGQLVGYGPGGVPVAVDAPSGGSGYDDAPLVARVVSLEQEPAPTWAEVTGKPTAFVPAVHGHSISDVTGLRAELDAIPAAYDDFDLSGRVAAVSSYVAAIPAPYDDTALAGRVTEVEGDVVTAQSRADAAYSLAQQGGGTGSYDDTALSGRVSALEDAPAPSWDDVTGKPTEFTPAIHGHLIGDVSGLTDALDGKAPTSHSHAWTEITGKPTTFAPSAHTHAWDEITSKPATFAPSAHGHSVSDVSGLQTALDSKQPATTFKAVNGQAITGTGNIVTAQSFATDAEAVAFSTANPGVVVFSRQA